jgi:polygalacturonase
MHLLSKSSITTTPFLLLIFFIYFSSISYASYSKTCSGIVPFRQRADTISITDFGGVGDGKTLNTKAFRAAIYRIQHLKRRGGTVLYVPPGVFLTESFNLTSHMTLYLAAGAVIKATQVSIFIHIFFSLIV